MSERQQKVVVVTGGSGGIGRAAVQAFARSGYDVAILARGQEGLDGAVADVRSAGGRPLGIPVDVSDYHAVETAADRVEAELGPIDCWVNVAASTRSHHSPRHHHARHAGAGVKEQDR